MQNLKRRSISITDEQWAYLVDLADKEFDGKVSVLLRHIIRDYLRKAARKNKSA